MAKDKENSNNDDTISINPSEFIIPASDSKGHSSRIQARVQPGLAREIDKKVASHIFPYKTIGDFIRHAVTRHIKYLDSIGPFKSNVQQIEAMNDVLRDAQFFNDFEDIFSRLQSQVNGYMGTGKGQQARALVANVRNHIEKMPDGDWKEMYMEKLNLQFGHFLMGSPISFDNFVDE